MAVLVNPASGRGRSGATGQMVADRLIARGDAVSVLAGDTAAHTGKLVGEAVATGTDVVVAVGGDGLIHLAVQHLAGTDTALGIVPSGSGNDYARALGIPRRDSAAAIDLIATTAPVALDLARLDRPPRTGSGDTSDGGTGNETDSPPRWFAEVMSAGFDSRVNARANRMRFPRGGARYSAAVLAELGDTRGIDVTVSVDGVAHRHRAEMVTVGVTAYYGGGLAMLTGADPTDGQLDVLVVDELSPLRLLTLFPRVFTGSHLRLPVVHRYRGTRVAVTADRKVLSYADGEPFVTLPVSLSCVRGAVRVFCGKDPARGRVEVPDTLPNTLPDTPAD